MLTLLEKLYGPREAAARKTFEKLLESAVAGLDAQVKIVGKDERNWIQIEINGSDSKVATNYLRKKFSVAPSLTDIGLPMTAKGKIVDAGKVGYGLYADIGLNAQGPLDVLIPLHRLRSHLTDGVKLPLREIANLFCLYDNLPFSFRLTKIDAEGKKLWGEPSDAQVELFKEWISKGLDRIIVLGAYGEQIESALRRSGAERDIIKVDALGFLEYALCCKHGTDAPGMIKILGTYLPAVPFHAFSPKKINKALGLLPTI